MSDIKFRSDIRVELLRHGGSDLDIARAAWVCPPDDGRADGADKVIAAMMKGRHGTPFEHGSLAFFVEAPIFVFREWHRHRIGWSYNEVSARYRVMEPQFYVPPAGRPCREPDGFKPMRPVLDDDADLREFVEGRTKRRCEDAWWTYQDMLQMGVAREVARNVLPVCTYSAMHATCNPRSLMAFLSLRTRDELAAVKSYPQWEIELAARQMEAIFAAFWPLTHAAFLSNGRVAP